MKVAKTCRCCGHGFMGKAWEHVCRSCDLLSDTFPASPLQNQSPPGTPSPLHRELMDSRENAQAVSALQESDKALSKEFTRHNSQPRNGAKTKLAAFAK